ncbi:MAG TPA: hypothetical protein VF203_14270 [Burkholderiales bacterium]
MYIDLALAGAFRSRRRRHGRLQRSTRHRRADGRRAAGVSRLMRVARRALPIHECMIAAGNLATNYRALIRNAAQERVRGCRQDGYAALAL